MGSNCSLTIDFSPFSPFAHLAWYFPYTRHKTKPQKTTNMKTTFKFHFLMIIAGCFITAATYGLGETFVINHQTAFSFGMLVITVLGISGMMRNLPTMSPVKVRDNKK
jgi:hypothetical protein